MLRKVMSGGQDGVDIAALRAAKAVGIATGGVMPKGFLTVSGLKPHYADLYDMVEATTPDYVFRTRANVSTSDLTIFIGARSNGYYATKKAADDYGMPFLHFSLSVFSFPVADTWLLVADILQAYSSLDFLNIAGNRDADEVRAERWLTTFLEEMLAKSK